MTKQTKARKTKRRVVVGERYHVYPVNDFAEHDIDGVTCWCVPVVKAEGSGHIVIHNALDGRESNDVTTRMDT